MSKRPASSDSSAFKTVTSLTLSPTIAVALLCNTAIIHATLALLNASNKVKTKDQRTLLNVFKDAPGHVPTQMLHYLEGFYGYLWENWTKSAENTFGKIPNAIDNEIRQYFNIDSKRDFYQEIIDTWNDCLKMPNPSPSPVNVKQLEASASTGVGVL